MDQYELTATDRGLARIVSGNRMREAVHQLNMQGDLLCGLPAKHVEELPPFQQDLQGPTCKTCIAQIARKEG